MRGLYDAITILVAVLFIPPPICADASLGNPFNDPTNDQFHIQTDEGPERYFRYQTQSGQYRKEKRLEDGTVVGSYGWIDSTGLLRLRDYIADNAGYRILRTKDIYVGRNRPISQAIKAAKKVPGVTGTSLPSPVAPSLYLPPVSSTTPRPITPTQIPSVVSVTPPSYISSTYLPQVDINHHSYSANSLSASDLNLGQHISIHSTTQPPPVSSTILPPPYPTSPYPTHAIGSSTPGTVVISPKSPYPTYLPSSTAGPAHGYFSGVAPSSTPSPIFVTTHRPSYSPIFLSTTPHSLPSPTPQPGYYDTPYNPSTIAPPINSNSLDYYDSNENPYIHHNGPTYPIDRHGNSYFGRAQNRQTVPGNNPVVIGNGYDPQYPQYNGVSVTNDGFRYYIPRAYHEEQDTGYSKSGSFGYIDPFGIRRVVYYNAGANGFQHRKNNRYVGFNATPYDPRPYKKKK